MRLQMRRSSAHRQRRRRAHNRCYTPACPSHTTHQCRSNHDARRLHSVVRCRTREPPRAGGVYGLLRGRSDFPNRCTTNRSNLCGASRNVCRHGWGSSGHDTSTAPESLRVWFRKRKSSQLKKQATRLLSLMCNQHTLQKDSIDSCDVECVSRLVFACREPSYHFHFA